jgi:DNA-directed RNA polymerase
MTYVYSATRYGVQDMILQTLRELDAEGEPYLGGADNYEAANYLSYIMFEAIAEVVSAATTAMEWLRSVAKVASQRRRPLTWTTPDGFPSGRTTASPTGSGSRSTGGAADQADAGPRQLRPGHRGQANGIAPNFVHSLDAAHLRALARAAKGGRDRLPGVVHDSFATHAARTDDLARLLRETFVEQYEPDLLASSATRSRPTPGKQVPPAPEFGELDLEEVRRSLPATPSPGTAMRKRGR